MNNDDILKQLTDVGLISYCLKCGHQQLMTFERVREGDRIVCPRCTEMAIVVGSRILQHAILTERTRVVEYLRGFTERRKVPHHFDDAVALGIAMRWIRDLASAIERGEHRS